MNDQTMVFLSWHEEQDITNGSKSAGISRAVTINVTGLPSPSQSCVYSSFNQLMWPSL